MKKTIAIISFLLIIIPVLAFAATPCTINTNNKPPVTPSDLPRCVNQIYVWSLGVAALLALLMTVIGGYEYMTAAGNAEKSSSGIEKIWGSVIGLALLFGAYLLLNTINPDLVNFDYISNDLNQLNQTQTPPATNTPRN